MFCVWKCRLPKEKKILTGKSAGIMAGKNAKITV
jgi:hypothetical protein